MGGYINPPPSPRACPDRDQRYLLEDTSWTCGTQCPPALPCTALLIGFKLRAVTLLVVSGETSESALSDHRTD